MASDPPSRTAEAALRERVKELTCLYGIAQIAARPDKPVKDILQDIVELIPPAWQYPEVAYARIVADGRAHATPGFSKGPGKQSAPIIVAGRPRGAVELVYVEERPAQDEGPFLKEERKLLEAVAGQVASILERRDAEQDKARLQDQLRHADRLATIGQLAAGVAHELNEPLGNILGYAQLAMKHPGLPPPATGDLEKIKAASLHAREIIRKLLVFARQVPPRNVRVDLNGVIEEGLHFFGTRCARDGVDLVLRLSPKRPEVIGDPGQLNQVLVNLVVNALQAMPNGGRLTVETRVREGRVLLVVEDTGIGMSPEVIGKLFVPFFTTKDVGEGTGLGLPVAHGIVTSHGGTLRVRSAVGRGARFEISLPPARERPRHVLGPRGGRKAPSGKDSHDVAG